MRKLIIALVLCGILGFSAVLAQAQGEQCQALAQATFDALDSGCGSLAGNQACFGAFASVIGATSPFEATGDVIPLAEVQQLSTARLSLDENIWGIARLNVPANVPLAVSDAGLVFLLIGDAIIENAVDPATAFVPAPPATLQVLVAANVRSAPNTDARVVVGAPAGSELVAEGVNGDRTWVRVVFGDSVGWISSQVVVVTEGSLSELPIIGNDSRTLMQSFIFQSGTVATNCSSLSPSMLVIQSPNGINASITVNGTDIRFNDTIVLRTSEAGQLQLTVLSGSVGLGVLSVPAGFTVFAPLSADGRNVTAGWTNLRPITPDERGFFGILELIPASGLHTALRVPTADEVTTTLTNLNRGAAGGGSCPGFQALAPLDGIAYGSTTFYWDALSSAAQYRLNVFREGGVLTKSEVIDSYSTTLTTDTTDGGIGLGYVFSWNVEALDRSGRVICTTGTVNTLRSAAPQRAGGGGGSANTSGGGGQSCTWDC